MASKGLILTVAQELNLVVCVNDMVRSLTHIYHLIV